MKIGIVGYGFVGKALGKIFTDAVIYDKYKNIGTKGDVNKCDIVFVSVPTPTANDGNCDTTIVEEVIDWLDVPIICIKSTVPPGTTRDLAAKSGKVICHSPEFRAEALLNLSTFDEGRIIVGGINTAAEKIIRAYQERLGAEIKYFMTDSMTSELVKYIVNAYLATKVAFFNQVKNISEPMGLNYEEVRELTLTEERIGRSHTLVTDRGGYGGHCFPKDTKAMIAFSDGLATILEAVDKYNEKIRGGNYE